MNTHSQILHPGYPSERWPRCEGMHILACDFTGERAEPCGSMADYVCTRTGCEVTVCHYCAMTTTCVEADQEHALAEIHRGDTISGLTDSVIKAEESARA